MHGNSKSDAVPDSWLIFCVLLIYTCCKRKRNVLGQNWSQTAYLRSKCTVRWDRTVRFGAVHLLIPYYTVKATIRRLPYRIYGVILEIRRSATFLHKILYITATAKTSLPFITISLEKKLLCFHFISSSFSNLYSMLQAINDFVSPPRPCFQDINGNLTWTNLFVLAFWPFVPS